MLLQYHVMPAKRRHKKQSLPETTVIFVSSPDVEFIEPQDNGSDIHKADITKDPVKSGMDIVSIKLNESSDE